MLIRYKKNLEKIAMGLLSFMPEEKKDVKELLQTIKEYETNPNWHLYLWKEDDGVLGAIGVSLEDKNAYIQHISVSPSHRNIGIGKKMVKEIYRIYEQQQYYVYAIEVIKEFFERCISDSENTME